MICLGITLNSWNQLSKIQIMPENDFQYIFISLLNNSKYVLLSKKFAWTLCLQATFFA